MEYKLMDKNARKPLYKQLVEEILLDIKTAKLKSNDKLPTEREMADKLQISRGTVKKAYSELANTGVITMIQGSGSYIYNTENEPKNQKKKLVVTLVDELTEKLLSWNYSPAEISNLINSSLAKKTGNARTLHLAIIDCNVEFLEIFKQQLLYYIANIQISSFLLETILLTDYPQDFLAGYDLIVTTTSHYEQVAERIGNLTSKLIKVASSISKDAILNISHLTPDSKISILCSSAKFAYIVKEHILEYVPQIKNIETHYENDLESENQLPILKQYDTLILNPDSIFLSQKYTSELLKEYMQSGGKIIPFKYQIDNGSLIYLEEKIVQIKNKHQL